MAYNNIDGDGLVPTLHASFLQFKAQVVKTNRAGVAFLSSVSHIFTQRLSLSLSLENIKIR